MHILLVCKLVVVLVVLPQDTSAQSQCVINDSSLSSIFRNDNNDDYLVISSVQSAKECCSILSSNPDYNTFVYFSKNADCPSYFFDCISNQTLSSQDCQLQYQREVAAGNKPNVQIQNPQQEFVSGYIPFKNRGWSSDVIDGLQNLILNEDAQLAASYIYQMFMGSWNLTIPYCITNTIEEIITDGGCKHVFTVLKEVGNMIVDESVSVKLQEGFTSSSKAFLLDEGWLCGRHVSYSSGVKCMRGVQQLYIFIASNKVYR